MKIISKFSDYYDGVASMDREALPIWRREKKAIIFADVGRTKENKPFFDAAKKIDIKHNRYNSQLEKKKSFLDKFLPHPELDIDLFVCGILFCGKLYYGFRLNPYDFKDSTGFKVRWEFEKLRDEYSQRETKCSKSKKADNLKAMNKLIKTYKELQGPLVADGNGKMDEIHLFFNSPIVVKDIIYGGNRITVNGCLIDYNFQSIMDPYTAYQEIDMFMGNNMAQQFDPDAHTNDKLKVHAHGFNSWSFRTHPDESGKPRRKKKK